MRDLFGLVCWLALVVIAGAIGAVASVEAGSLYAQLIRPTWAPPGSVFAPVWSILYVMMGVSAWLVWRERSVDQTALVLFLVQLVVNALWSWWFFAWRLGAFAFVDVIILLALIAATIIAFWRLQRLAALLLFPYFVWVCFASALTWSVWQNNPQLLG